jgi:hypothetical protein
MPVTTSKKMKLEDDNEDENNSTNFVHVKKEDNIKSKLSYNSKTIESYKKNGLDIPDNLDYQERMFISKVSVNEKLGHKIKITVTKIVRIRAPDYSTKRLERKEFLYYFENWNGKDWVGRKIAPVTDHVEGLYNELEMEPKINDRMELTGYKRSGQHTVYYIPFSKEKVDEIIENSVGSDKDTIKFLFTDNGLGFEFPYEIFVNLDYQSLVKILISPNPKAEVQKLQLEVWQQQQQQQQKQSTTNQQQQQEQVIKQKQ